MPDPNAYENTTRTVQTRLGDLEYVGGFPTAETVRRAYDQLDVQRAAQVCLLRRDVEAGRLRPTLVICAADATISVRGSARNRLFHTVLH